MRQSHAAFEGLTIRSVTARPGQATSVRAFTSNSVAVVVLSAILTSPAPADAPLPPPATTRVTSPRGTCQAVASVGPARITVQAQPGHTSWSLPFWNPNLVLSDDCAILGIGYFGSNLLTTADRNADTVVMTFYRQGQIARTVRLDELYPDLAVLPATASHWLWFQKTDWNGRDWTVHTVDGRMVAFEP